MTTRTNRFLGRALAAALISTSCTPASKSGRGLRLPDGDIEKGKAAFTQLECNACHTVAGVDLPPPVNGSRIDVALGGEVLRVKTYGDLVTSIANPSHEVSSKFRESLRDSEGKSIMPEFGDRMTVSQLIDLVAFLHSRYKLLEPDYSDFPYP